MSTHIDRTGEHRADPPRWPGGDRIHDAFLSSLSHELRNPLAPLRNAVRLLRAMQHETTATPRIPPDALYDLMDRQLDQLVHVVDDLVEASRVDGNTIELQPEPVRIAQLIRDATEASHRRIDALGHQMLVHRPPEEIEVVGDRLRLAQIVSSLLENAARFTPRDGSIAVDIGTDGDMASITVRDDGIGIAQDELPTVFELFARSSVRRARVHGGLGVGLATARRLAELHGGSLEAASEGPGRGSAFTLRLPLRPPPAPADARDAADAGEPPDAAHRIDGRVLVVDDNVDAAESLASLLEIDGAEVECAHEGAAALDAFERFAPDSVVLDLGMPGIGGLDVARAIRSRPGGDRVLLIALTGWGEDQDRMESRQAGFDHHMVKPVALEELRALLENPAREPHRA
ncbi:MAG: ATP-binding protein [Lautropia sp.]